MKKKVWFEKTKTSLAETAMVVMLGEVRSKSPPVLDLEQVAATGTAEVDIAAFLGNSPGLAGGWGKELVHHRVVRLLESHKLELNGPAKVVVGNTLFEYLSSMVVAPASGRLVARPTALDIMPSLTETEDRRIIDGTPSRSGGFSPPLYRIIDPFPPPVLQVLSHAT